MRIRALIREIVPPFVLRVYHKSKAWYAKSSPRAYIYEGLYREFSSVPIKGEGHAGRWWIDLNHARTAKCKSETDKRTIVPLHVRMYHKMVPAFLVGLAQTHLKIVDFGGGMGMDYLSLRSCLSDSLDVEYHVIDSDDSCRKGRALFGDAAAIYFHNSFPVLTNVDIVMTANSIQYIHDIPAILEKLASYAAPYLFILNLCSGEAPRMATAQANFEDGSRLACWLFDVREIIRILHGYGYSLVYRCACDQDLGMGRLSPEYASFREVHLVFRLKIR